MNMDFYSTINYGSKNVLVMYAKNTAYDQSYHGPWNLLVTHGGGRARHSD